MLRIEFLCSNPRDLDERSSLVPFIADNGIKDGGYHITTKLKRTPPICTLSQWGLPMDTLEIHKYTPGYAQ